LSFSGVKQQSVFKYALATSLFIRQALPLAVIELLYHVAHPGIASRAKGYWDNPNVALYPTFVISKITLTDATFVVCPHMVKAFNHLFFSFRALSMAWANSNRSA
jgi:hypothetical protein